MATRDGGLMQVYCVPLGNFYLLVGPRPISHQQMREGKVARSKGGLVRS